MLILEALLFVSIGVIFSGPILRVGKRVVAFFEEESKKI